MHQLISKITLNLVPSVFVMLWTGWLKVLTQIPSDISQGNLLRRKYKYQRNFTIVQQAKESIQYE